MLAFSNVGAALKIDFGPLHSISSHKVGGELLHFPTKSMQDRDPTNVSDWQLASCGECVSLGAGVKLSPVMTFRLYNTLVLMHKLIPIQQLSFATSPRMCLLIHRLAVLNC